MAIDIIEEYDVATTRKGTLLTFFPEEKHNHNAETIAGKEATFETREGHLVVRLNDEPAFIFSMAEKARSVVIEDELVIAAINKLDGRPMYEMVAQFK